MIKDLHGEGQEAAYLETSHIWSLLRNIEELCLAAKYLSDLVRYLRKHANKWGLSLLSSAVRARLLAPPLKRRDCASVFVQLNKIGQLMGRGFCPSRMGWQVVSPKKATDGAFPYCDL